MKRLPIKAARDLAEKYDQQQVIVVTWDFKEKCMHVVTYGSDIKNCEEAALGGNKIKRALGFPEESCNTQPSRMKRLKTKESHVMNGQESSVLVFLAQIHRGNWSKEKCREAYDNLSSGLSDRTKVMARHLAHIEKSTDPEILETIEFFLADAERREQVSDEIMRRSK